MNRNKQWLTILTVALLMFHVAAGEEEEEVFEEQPLSSAEKYVDFLSNGGAVSEYPDEEVDQDAVDASNTADYESETLDMLLSKSNNKNMDYLSSYLHHGQYWYLTAKVQALAISQVLCAMSCQIRS